MRVLLASRAFVRDFWISATRHRTHYVFYGYIMRSYEQRSGVMRLLYKLRPRRGQEGEVRLIQIAPRYGVCTSS